MKTILTGEKLDTWKALIGENSRLLLDETRNFFTVLGENEYLLSFHWLDEKKVVVYAATSIFVLMSDSETVRSYGETVSENADGLMQFHQFLLELTASDIYKLESLENMIISLEDQLLLDTIPSADGLHDIIKVRKDILKVKRYYEHMEFLTDEMAGVDSSFDFISQKFTKLLDFVNQLQTYIESVREAYQSQIDIEQNNIMKFFTVVTTIFTPISVIAGWYGMGFVMPEYDWKFGYLFVISLSILSVLSMIVVFRRKGWF